MAAEGLHHHPGEGSESHPDGPGNVGRRNLPPPFEDTPAVLPLGMFQLSSMSCCCAWLTALTPPRGASGSPGAAWSLSRTNKVCGPLAPYNVPVSLPSLLPGNPPQMRTLHLGHAVRISFASNLFEEGREGSHGATGCSSVGSSNTGWVYGEEQGAHAAPSIPISSTLQSGCVMTLGYKELMMGQRAPK